MKKFDEVLALQVFKDRDLLSEEEVVKAVGYVYLWLDISGEDIQDLDRCYFNEVKAAFDELLETIQCYKRYPEIISMRYGLDGLGAKTLDEIGSVYNVKGSGMGSIVKKVLRMFRHPARSNDIKHVFHKTEFLQKQIEDLKSRNALLENELDESKASLYKCKHALLKSKTSQADEAELKAIKAKIANNDFDFEDDLEVDLSSLPEMNDSIDELNLPLRIIFRLSKAGFKTIGDLYHSTIEGLREIGTLKAKDVEEILETLNGQGIFLKEK